MQQGLSSPTATEHSPKSEGQGCKPPKHFHPADLPTFLHRICCTACGTNYQLRTRIHPDDWQGHCQRCGASTISLGVIRRG